MYPKLCYVSRVSLVDGIYQVYFDIAKFLILWVHLHCYNLSPQQQIYPTLTNGWIDIMQWSCNNALPMIGEELTHKKYNLCKIS